MGDRTSLAATIGGTKDFLNNYSYDALGEMTAETQQGQSGGNAVAPKGVSFGYDAIGDITSIERYTNLTQSPSPATDAADTAIGYSSLGQLTSIVHSHNGTTIEGLTYGYDTLSRVNAISSTIDGETALGYDVNSQLVSAMYSGTGAPPNDTESYDKNGNRTNPGYTIGAGNLITSDGTFNYTHDGEGNVTSRTRISTAYASDYEVDYSWDFRNRLTDTLFYDNNHVLTKHVHDVYDVFDQLIEQDVDPTGSGTYTQIVHHVWDGEGIVLDFNGQNQLTERYLNGPNTSATDSVFSTLAEEQVSSLTSPGTVTFNLLDNLGSVRDVVDANGVLQDHIDYTAFGQVAHESNSAVHHLTGFAGGLPDPNTGLVLFGHRWYDAANAVWMSPDPLGFGGGDANLQRYVDNDPANETDPTGLAVGHHYVPVAVLNDLYAEGKISRSAYSLAMGYYTGPTYPKHGYLKYGALKHSQYNAKIKVLLKAELDKCPKCTKMTAAQMRSFIEDDILKSTDKEIRSFNDAIHKQRAAFLKRPGQAKPPAMLPDKELIRRGKNFVKSNAFRVAQVTGVMAGALGAYVMDYAEALAAVGRNRNFKAVVKSLSEGDMAGADRAMGKSHNGSGLIGDLLFTCKTSSPATSLEEAWRQARAKNRFVQRDAITAANGADEDLAAEEEAAQAAAAANPEPAEEAQPVEPRLGGGVIGPAGRGDLDKIPVSPE